jgi:hypothetical protein
MAETKDQNGTLYIGQEVPKMEFFTHQATIDGNHYIESAVCGRTSFLSREQ